MNSKVDEFFDRIEKWQNEFQQLRMIILNSGLTENYKWRILPCCNHQNNRAHLFRASKKAFRES
ncbi:MAG TPA: hypothetical protein DCR48_02950 [Flavobacteriales bacterium]|nr:hypothetical protein [Flavobacteriales bacterium]